MSNFSGLLSRSRSTARGVSALGAAAAMAVAGLTLVVTSSPANADNNSSTTSPSYSLSGGATLIRSKGLPVSATGFDNGLWSNNSSVTRTVTATSTDGSHIRLVGRGDFCQGWPTVSVSVDGTAIGTATLSNATMNLSYDVGSGIAAGTHTVTVSLVNDKFVPGTCDRNAYITAFDVANDTSDASSAGVPAGVKLTDYYGNYYATTDNQVVNGLDIHGELFVSGKNVTVINTRVRGGDINTYNQVMKRYALATLTGAGDTISDSTLHADIPNPNWNGLTGYGFTAERVDISGVVDTIMTYGDNVTVDHSYTHDNLQYEHDWSWNFKGTPSHSDGWQIEAGSNIKLTNSNIVNPPMTGMVMTQNAGKTDNVTISGNHLSGGTCTVNLEDNKNRGYEKNVSITNNVFGPVSTNSFFPVAKGCHIISKFQTVKSTLNVPSTITHPTLTLSGNTSTDGYPVIVAKGNF